MDGARGESSSKFYTSFCKSFPACIPWNRGLARRYPPVFFQFSPVLWYTIYGQLCRPGCGALFGKARRDIPVYS